MLRICSVHDYDLIYISKEGVFDYYYFLVDWLAPCIWIWVGGPCTKVMFFFFFLISFSTLVSFYTITIYCFFFILLGLRFISGGFPNCASLTA